MSARVRSTHDQVCDHRGSTSDSRVHRVARDPRAARRQQVQSIPHPPHESRSPHCVPSSTRASDQGPCLQRPAPPRSTPLHRRQSRNNNQSPRRQQRARYASEPLSTPPPRRSTPALPLACRTTTPRIEHISPEPSVALAPTQAPPPQDPHRIASAAAQSPPPHANPPTPRPQ